MRGLRSGERLGRLFKVGGGLKDGGRVVLQLLVIIISILVGIHSYPFDIGRVLGQRKKKGNGCKRKRDAPA